MAIALAFVRPGGDVKWEKDKCDGVVDGVVDVVKGSSYSECNGLRLCMHGAGVLVDAFLRLLVILPDPSVK